MNESFPPNLRLDYSSAPPGESGISRRLSWIVIIGCVALVSGMNFMESQKSAGPAVSTRVDPTTALAGRYLVGAHSLASRIGQGQAYAPQFVKQFDDTAKTPVAKLAAVTVVAELQGKQAAIDRLYLVEPYLTKTLRPTAAALRIVYTLGPQELSPGEQILLDQQLGWFDTLAHTIGKSDADPQRAALLSAATHVCIILAVVVITIPVGLIAGVLLLLVLLIRLNDGKMRRHYEPISAGGSLFLEAFAIYLAGFVVASLAASHLPAMFSKTLGAYISLMALPTALAIFWPIIRGVRPGVWRHAIGWHSGRGLFREMGMGLVGYLGGFPILAVGFGITLALIKISGANPTHPVEHMLGGSMKTTLLVIFLVSIYAPITEETMFRGALFHSLRARHRWFISATVSAFIFAAIHPQGWTVVPTLMAIAIVFAGIREWRGTILSSATAHCFHNSVLLAVAIQVLK